ncbi:MAG: flagellar motor protein MotB [Pseudomonadota bacterium]
MGANANAPIIIKRKKVVGGDGHHGGAWKVAYADFVTAMMAFFLLMWLLNATTEKQRKGLADHFSPTIPINRSSGGGDGALSGDSIFTEETLARSGVGATSPQEEKRTISELPFEQEMLEDLETRLLGAGAEALLSEQELRHIVTRISDEGLVVEIFSLPGAPLFDAQTDAPQPLFERLVTTVGQVFALAVNDIAIDGHSRSVPVVLSENPVWERTIARARAAKVLMEAEVEPERIDRLVGHADRDPVTADPLAVRNDRVELLLLRRDVPDLRRPRSAQTDDVSAPTEEPAGPDGGVDPAPGETDGAAEDAPLDP